MLSHRQPYMSIQNHRRGWLTILLLCTPLSLLFMANPAAAQAFATASASPQLAFGGANNTPQQVSNTITIPNTGTIQDIHVAVQIDHSWVGDIHLTLTSPLGVVFDLQTGDGGNSDNLNLIYADAGVPYGSQPFDFACHMQPDGGSFGVFANSNVLGNWTLSVFDDFPTSADGTLQSWTITFFNAPVAAVPPPVQNLACNPNNGGAQVSWTNSVSYAGLTVLVDGAAITSLPGGTTSYVLSNYAPGQSLEVEIEATGLNGSQSCRIGCSVVPLGPPPPILSDKVVMVIIDGLRYEDGLGHPTRANTPCMDALAQQGTIIEPFTNDNITITNRAIPAMNCGSWEPPIQFVDPICGTNNQYSSRPTIHEYFRQQRSRPDTDCQYMIGTFCPWRGSYHPSYGPNTWPLWVPTNGSDNDVWAATQTAILTDAPSFLTVYLSDVDHEGHSNNFANYEAAIQNADQIVGDLWDLLQSTPEYANRTTMVISNDHGRHWYDFSGHGDSCTGCRAIQLLAVGPAIKRNHVSTIPRSTPDITPTLGALLGVYTEYADGNVMTEIFSTCQEDLGLGGPGNAKLQFCGGDLSTGTSADIRLSLAPNSNIVYGLVSLNLNPLVTVGGTLLDPTPDQIHIFATNAAGALTIPNLPGGGGPMDVYLQFVFVDPSLVPNAPHVGFSNILKAQFLP